MFKKNDTYKQLNAFAICNNLNKHQLNLLEKSKEHYFLMTVFDKIDESIFSILYSDKYSRPNVPVNQMVGALILKHLYDWTYEELFTHLNFNILTRHSIGIQNSDEGVFCPASLFNFQNKLLKYKEDFGIDLVDQVFNQLTQDQISNLGVKTSIQRGDSFLIGSNIVNYSRLQLLIEVLKRLSRIVEKEDLIKEISPYLKDSASNYVYHVNKEKILTELNAIGKVYLMQYKILGNRFINRKEYQDFKRVLFENFHWDDNKKDIGIKDSMERHSGVLMSPDDIEATYRDKRSKKSKGYVGHISETVNPKNKVNLITDVIVAPNNIGDAELLERRLPEMVNKTPDIEEYFVDGQYGSPNVDILTQLYDIKLYQKNIRGKESTAGIEISEEQDNYKVKCKGGQVVEAKIAKTRFKATFDPLKCSKCLYNKSCKLYKSTSIKTGIKRILYFDENRIRAHKRYSNYKILRKEKQYYRANVEATVKELKRGMKNDKVRIRGKNQINHYALFTSLAINFVRIWSKREQFLNIYSRILSELRQAIRIENYFAIKEKLNFQELVFSK